MPVTGVLLCLDVTEQVVDEAIARGMNMIVSHHPVLFRGLKQITGSTVVQRIVIKALQHNVAIYSAHTNLDSARGGVSSEMAHRLGLRNQQVLVAHQQSEYTGLGIVGDIEPMPAIEFLRKLKEIFEVQSLRYSADSHQLVIRRVAVCGGAGAEFIPAAVRSGANIMVTGDVKYHDYTTYGSEILIADVGHYESEVGCVQILARLLRVSFPVLEIGFAGCEHNPVAVM